MIDAINLSKRGIRVMPVHGLRWNKETLGCTCGKRDCKSVAKHPIFSQWQKLGLESIDTIEAWYRTYKDANLGVITGKDSGVIVLDIDPKNGGFESLQQAEERYDSLPDTPTVITGSGGRHYYFRHPGGKLTNRAGMLGGGVDIRGDGGFVVAPHSKHVQGQYEWEISPDEIEFADIPQWLFREIQQSGSRTSTAPQVTGEVTISEGGRDAWLISMAGVLRRKGLGLQAIGNALNSINKYHCDPPLEQADIIRIARSICRYPAGTH